MTRYAILELSPEFLAAILQLPEGSYIDALEAPQDRAGVIRLRLHGAGWPTTEGALIPVAVGTVTRTPDRDVIDWGLPSAEG